MFHISDSWDSSQWTIWQAVTSIIGIVWLYIDSEVAISQLLQLFVYRLLRAVYNLTLHPLAKFPGPIYTAISRYPLVFVHFRGKQYQFVEHLHNYHGPIVRIAPDELTITDARAWNEIYARRPGLHKDPLSLQPPLNNAHTLFTAEDATHTRLRRLIGKGFSEQALRAQSSTILEHVECLIAHLKDLSESDGKCMSKF